MSAIAQQKCGRGPAKIIPFPVVPSVRQKRRAWIAQYLFWILLCSGASVGGEFWSLRLSNAAVTTPSSQQSHHFGFGSLRSAATMAQLPTLP
jgi:hypothetical protein